MGYFSKLSTVKTYSKSAYFQPGNYIVEIQKVKLNEGGYKGDSFVIEAKVKAVTSDHPEVPKVGTICAHVWAVSGAKREMGMANWMEFMSAVTGCSPDEKSDDDWQELSEAIIDEDQLNGTDMLLQVFMTKTKAGNDFTVHKWQGFPSKEDYEEFGISE